MISSGYIILAILVGGLIGYFIFYLRYQHKDTVNELRSHVKEANKEIQFLNGELDEYLQQNNILKEKVTDLLAKNDDMSDVVSELSKYYVHIKKAAEKTTELTKFLQSPNPNIEEKMQPYLNKVQEKKDDDMKKSFF
ncbi:MAG: hypothetical protein WC872_00435 [Candidatus Absconditabacterales bacterium]